MAQAANLEEVHVPILLSGKFLNTSVKHLFSPEQMRSQHSDGECWQLFDDHIVGQIYAGPQMSIPRRFNISGGR